jgi:signal transduction histidine kinase
MVTQAREGSGLKFRLSLKSSSRRELPSDVALHLYRITQGALSNAMRHSGATRVTVSLEEGAESVRLRIADNGAGLPAPAEASGGLGLRIMQYRAQLIGATLELRRPTAGGTALVVTWRPGSGQEGAT